MTNILVCGPLLRGVYGIKRIFCRFCRCGGGREDPFCRGGGRRIPAFRRGGRSIFKIGVSDKFLRRRWCCSCHWM